MADSVLLQWTLLAYYFHQAAVPLAFYFYLRQCTISKCFNQVVIQKHISAGFSEPVQNSGGRSSGYCPCFKIGIGFIGKFPTGPVKIRVSANQVETRIPVGLRSN